MFSPATIRFTYVYTPKPEHKCRQRNPTKDARIELSRCVEPRAPSEVLPREPGCNAARVFWCLTTGGTQLGASQNQQMPITQIPFQDPVAPPEKPQPEQLGLYDTQDWETAYRELDARVPHLLIQLQDDLERSRRREAAWISIIAHLLLAILLFSPLWDMIQKTMGWHSVAVVPLNANKDNTTFLALPPDLQKVPHRPN